jgi:O-antigen ligase
MIQMSWNIKKSRNVVRILLMAWTLVLIVVFSALAGVMPTLTIAVLVGIVTWLFMAAHPEISLAIVLAGFYLYPTISGLLDIDTSSELTAVIYFLLTTSYLLGGLLLHPNRIRQMLRRPTNVVGFTFVVWMIINWLVISGQNEYALRKMALMPLLMAAPFVASQLLDEERLRRTIFIAIGLGILSLVIATMNLVATGPTEIRRFSVSESFSPLWFAYSAGLSAVCFVTMTWDRSTVMRLGAIAMVVASVFYILASGSRGPLVALIAALVAVAIFRGRQRKLRLLLGLIMVGMALVVLLPLVPINALSRVQLGLNPSDLASPTDLNTITSGRADIWMLSLDLWLRDPIVGIGVGGYQSFDPLGQFPHNFVIETLTEMGLIGMSLFSVFLGMIAVILLRVIRGKAGRELPILAVGLFAYSLVEISLSGQVQTAIELWFTCGVILMLYHNLLNAEQTPMTKG